MTVNDRNASLDYLRLLAAVGIVWFHSMAEEGHRIAYLALPFFLVLLGRPSGAAVADKARRLLWPFLIWSVIHAVLQIALALRAGGPMFGWWQNAMVLSGTAVHLWFLPFAFLATVLMRLLRADWLAMVLPVLAAVVVIALPANLPTPAAQWVFGTVPLTLGHCYFRCGWRVVLPWAVCGAILFAGRTSPDNVTVVLGVAIAVLLLQIRLPRPPLSDRCARVALLMFLCHMVVMQAGWTLRLEGVALGLFAILGSLALALGIDALRGWRIARLLT
ncbi:MAG: acyltransferase family protein [Pseudorhodobacter sp.]